MTTEYVNWFVNDGAKNFEAILPPLADKEVRCLQIGAYTGDASVWLVDNVLRHPDSVLVDVDTWEGSQEPSHYEMNWKTVEQLYDLKTATARANRKILKVKGTSDWFFKNNLEHYDFIYVDGDHTAAGVLKDAVNSFQYLKPGGIIGFDDYLWSAGLGETKEPRIAIDAFYQAFKDELEVLVKDYQVWFKKKA